MTRVSAPSGAFLAHQNAFQRSFERRSKTAGQAKIPANHSARYGNRRMGDRRAHSRTNAGRRMIDRQNPISIEAWVSTSISAHLIGQWMEGEAISTQKAVERFVSATAAPQKGGVVV